MLLGNGDAHTKNWAYCYPDGRHAELSPAYDIVPTVLFVAGDDLGLNLAGSKRFDQVRLNAFDRLADKAGWDGDGRARAAAAVDRVVAAWSVLAEYLETAVVEKLTARRDSLPLLRP